MHIGFFHPAFGKPGGAELLCVAQAHYLRQAGDAVGLVTFVYDSQLWDERLQGLEVRVAQRKRWTDGLAWRPRWPRCAAAAHVRFALLGRIRHGAGLQLSLQHHAGRCTAVATQGLAVQRTAARSASSPGQSRC